MSTPIKKSRWGKCKFAIIKADDDKSVIDLTSDTDDDSSFSNRDKNIVAENENTQRAKEVSMKAKPNVEVQNDKKTAMENMKIAAEVSKKAELSSEVQKNKSGNEKTPNTVKQENVKRAAELSRKAEVSGEVKVAAKPSQTMNEITHPAKRTKGSSSGKSPAAAGNEEEEEDFEMIGTMGGSELPHNRFSCPENTFAASDKAGHKERCKLCFCYVCDRLATDCEEWPDHCHATTSGPTASTWKSLRARAKPLILAGKRPPVSDFIQGSPALLPPLASLQSWPSSSSLNSISSSDSLLRKQKYPCNCQELCQLVRKVIGPDEDTAKPVLYLAGLTEAQAQHVQEVAVEGTLKVMADEHVRKCHQTRTAEYQQLMRQNYVMGRGAYLQKTSAGETFDVTFAANKTMLNPSKPPWTFGQAQPAAIRLASVGDIGFEAIHLQTVNQRQALFDQFVSRTPLPISVWAGTNSKGGYLKLDDCSDIGLFAELESAHRDSLIDVEVKAEYDPESNRGSFAVDVVLLPRLLNRGADIERRDRYNGAVDFVTIVERLVLAPLYKESRTDVLSPAAATSSASADATSSASSAPKKGKGKSRKEKDEGSTSESTTDDISPATATSSSSFSPASSSSPSPSAAAAVAAVTSSASSASKKGKGKSRSKEDVASAGVGVVSSAGGNGAGATPAIGVTVAAGAVVGGPGRQFTPSKKYYGGRASTDVTLKGLVESLRVSERICLRPSDLDKVLQDLENVQHGALVKQPDCLTVQLFEHQLQAAQWMYDQEVMDWGTMQHLWAELPPHPQAPTDGDRSREFRPCWFSPILNQFKDKNPFTAGTKGGLLCDEMGLGKTAATLAVHLIHPPKTPRKGIPLDETEWGPISGTQATAMVAPRATSGKKKRPGTVVSKGTLVVCKVSLVGQWVEEAKRLCGGALCIYAYHGDYRKKDPEFLAKFDMVVTTYGVVQSDATRNKGYPPLRQIRWWRVVLDESHTIASKSNTTTVVNQLVANRRWCMTGTPCNNKFSDFNAQLDFVGVAGSFTDRNLGNWTPNTNTQRKVMAFLRRVVLRHSQKMKLGKTSLLGLPPITHEVEVLELPKKELEAYQTFEKALQEDYKVVRYRLLHANGSHTMAVLTLLNKFRQACSGGQLLTHQPQPAEVGDGREAKENDDGSSDDDAKDEQLLAHQPSSAKVGNSYKDDHGSCSDGCFDEGSEADDDDYFFGGEYGNDDGESDDDAITDSMDACCPMCHDLFDSPVKTQCGHAFCQPCIAGALTMCDDDEGPCPKCKATVRLGDLTPISEGTGSGSSAGGDGSNSSGVMLETKLKVLVEKLTDLHAKDPTSKSLVFSQYNSSLAWLKDALPKRGFGFRTLTGNMSRKQRTDALLAFSNDPPTTVFLLSVRAGAVGINLTQANNVFLLEPMLNLALEKQAIGRVHRLGQKRPVKVTKLVLADSVETRILAIQAKEASGGDTAGSGSGSSSSAKSGAAGVTGREAAKYVQIEDFDKMFGLH